MPVGCAPCYSKKWSEKSYQAVHNVILKTFKRRKIIKTQKNVLKCYMESQVSKHIILKPKYWYDLNMCSIFSYLLIK